MLAYTFFRYNSLAEPLQARRDTLESWQLLFQFYRDIEDEMEWIQDKLQTTALKDYGTSLESTQALVKKYQVSVNCVIAYRYFINKRNQSLG